MGAVADKIRASNDTVAQHGAARSVEARNMYRDLMALPPLIRREFVAGMDTVETRVLLDVTAREAGTPYGLWVDDPVGFVEDVLGETTWSKQREVLAAMGEHKRVAVPSAFGTGKTHIAARIALWRSLVYPPGTSLTVTTATRFRQVQRQLWPHIRMAVTKANLPLIADTTQLKGTTTTGTEVVVAYGFSAPPHDEAAVQGIHAPRLTIIVDEAGGISRVIGQALRGLLTGDDTRMLAIGNPATDDEGSWFEGLCSEDDVHTIRISAFDSPLLTGEVTGWCHACPPEMPRHRLGIHIVDQAWTDKTIEEFGDDAPYVIAKVHARFPKGGSNRAMPSDWIEAAIDAPDPDVVPGQTVRLSDLDLDDETAPHVVHYGSWVRLGVDVAADGGDELVIARIIGDVGEIKHTSSGATNQSATDVAGKVLVEIKKAERLRAALGTTAPVRVKIDAIGVGWGVASILKSWGPQGEGIHQAEIVSVIVSEGTGRTDEGELLRPAIKRDEMWLAGRALVQPRKGAPPQVRLRIDKRTMAQLSAPTYGTSATGKTRIETKKSMRQRGVTSPDRAEGLLLGFYEPLVEVEVVGPQLIV